MCYATKEIQFKCLGFLTLSLSLLSNPCRPVSYSDSINISGSAFDEILSAIAVKYATFSIIARIHNFIKC